MFAGLAGFPFVLCLRTQQLQPMAGAWRRSALVLCLCGTCMAWSGGSASTLMMGGGGGKARQRPSVRKRKGKAVAGRATRTKTGGDATASADTSCSTAQQQRKQQRKQQQQQQDLNAKEHAMECDAGLLTWPTIAEWPDEPTSVTTCMHRVHSDILLSKGNEPFCSRGLVHATDAPLLSVEACCRCVCVACVCVSVCVQVCVCVRARAWIFA